MGKNLSDYEQEGYEGCDGSLEISLFEYGLIWKCINVEKQEYHFIHGVTSDEDDGYTSFDWSDLSKEGFTDILHSSWFDLPAFLSFIGQESEKELSFPGDISAMIAYYGYENILGSSYNNFLIDNK